MGRPTNEILADIRAARRDNMKLYVGMRALVGALNVVDDATLALIEAAYEIDPAEAKRIHRQIAINDEAILALTRELCE